MNNSHASSYTVKDISKILNLSRTATYEFIKEDPPLRILRIGHAIRIHQDSFDKWFNGSSDDTNTTESTQKGGR